MDNTESRKSEGNNMGISLIELIVSIAIIGLLLLPVLTGFIIAARLNTESRTIQAEIDLAQSIMEEVKGISLEELINEYNIIGDDYYEVYPSGTGYALYQTNTFSMKDCYYLLKSNIDSKYNALITLDATPYLSSPGPGDTDYNSFRMPLIRDVDSSNHLVAIQSYETQLALAALYTNHISYAAGAGTAPLDITEIESNLDRSIRIDISEAAGSVKAVVELIYGSSVAGCGSVSYQLASKELSSSEEGIYLFYEALPDDSILIGNSTAYDFDVFIYEQGGAVSATPISMPSTVTLYSNLPGYESVKREEAKNRIFDICVHIYEASEAINPYDVYIPGRLCAQLQSTRGE